MRHNDSWRGGLTLAFATLALSLACAGASQSPFGRIERITETGVFSIMARPTFGQPTVRDPAVLDSLRDMLNARGWHVPETAGFSASVSVAIYSDSTLIGTMDVGGDELRARAAGRPDTDTRARSLSEAERTTLLRWLGAGDVR